MKELDVKGHIGKNIHTKHVPHVTNAPYTPYTPKTLHTLPAPYTPTVDEIKNASKLEFKTPSAKTLFEKYFQILSENGGRIMSSCKLCANNVPLRAHLRSTGTYVIHLEVCISKNSLIFSVSNFFDIFSTETPS